MGYDVFTSNGNNSITNHWIKKNNLDAIIIDDDFPKMEAGISTAFKISQRFHIGVILLCAWMSEEIEKIGSGLDLFYCLSKPFTNEELQKCLDLILKKQNN